MEFLTNLEEARAFLAARLKQTGKAGTVIAMGNFDGLHGGHQMVLDQAQKIARAENLLTLVVSFDPHPRRFFHPNLPPFRLMSLGQKRTLLAEKGIDAFLVMPFDLTLSKLMALDFLEDILLDALAMKHFVGGEGFCFGYQRQGTPEFLASRAAEKGFTFDLLTLSGDETARFSSSRLRSLLEMGRVKEAAEILGRPWAMAGEVVAGDQRGRTIGFPTANIDLQDFVHPKQGVYAGLASWEEGKQKYSYPAAINFGMRPTVDGQKLWLEAHLLDFEGDLYGKVLDIALVDYLRGEQKFSSLDELKSQIEKDCQKAREVLDSYTSLKKRPKAG